MPPTATAAMPSIPTPNLADCHTLEAVEARGLAAAQTEAQVTELQNTLQYAGPEATATALAGMGVQRIGDTPIAEATPAQLAQFLGSALSGAKLTQLQVEPRKRFLAQANASYAQAVKILPAMADERSLERQAILAFARANPIVLQRPDWPVIAAKFYLGEQAFDRQAAGTPRPAAPAATVPARPPVIVPDPKTIPATPVLPFSSAPGAPTRSTAALPAANRTDELSAKIASGKASEDEVDEYARLSLS